MPQISFSVIDGDRPFGVDSTVTASDEPLTIDLAFGPNPGTYWILHHAAVKGWLAKVGLPNMSAVGTASPEVTICMVPIGTPPMSLADAQSAVGVDFGKLGILIDTKANSIGQGGAALPLPGGGYEFSLISQGLNIPVPPGYTVRAYVACNPATAQPGPGAGSFGKLSCLVEVVPNAN